MRLRQGLCCCAILALFLPLRDGAQRPAPGAAFIAYSEARPILEAFAGELPAGLHGKSPEQLAAAWPGWVAERDAAIRARLELGDWDTVIHWMLLGTSFTKRLRLTPENIQHLSAPGTSAPSTEASAAGALLMGRVDDLLNALSSSTQEERIRFARRMLLNKGYRISEPGGRDAARVFLLEQLQRQFREQASYAETLDAARRLGNASEEFAARSTLYRERGLSLDTSLSPNLALERSLEEMQRRGLLAAGGVRRVAVIGPGLDFTDKHAGFDFYPQQTVQPFAVMDSLLRLGLAREEQLSVTTLDISPRVNEHVRGIEERARRGASYVVQLPLDASVPWKPELREYWKHFGERIGVAAPAAARPEALRHLSMRAVRIPARVLARLRGSDVNIVLARPELAAAAQFDLIVATNILVYYDTFEQSLALANIERMLRPGGFFLCNNALLELPFSGVRSVGYLTTQYSERPDDGDHMVWYQRRRE